MLCDVCANLLEHRHGIYGGPQSGRIKFRHHPTVSSLEQSAITGCQICYKIWNLLDTPLQNLLRKEEQCNTQTEITTRGGGDIYEEWNDRDRGFLTIAELQFREIPRHYLLRIEYSSRGFKSPDDLIRLSCFRNFRLVPCMENEFDGYSGNSKLSESSTMSDETFRRAEQWLDDCTSKHTRCNENKLVSEWLPTRLLYIGDANESKNTVRLIETANDKPSGPYVTLSHCWGSKSFIQLTRHTLEAFRVGIPMQSLPKTFNDAILVAKRLKVFYVWIDSLCILQDKDDLTDWHREASLMGNIYAYSYCNISAAVACDASQGLFFPRDPRSLRDSIATIDGTEYWNGVPELTYVVLDDDLWTEIDTSHVNTRGWVLQERLLAPRVLHYGHHQLYWECREMQSSESHPDGSWIMEMCHGSHFKAFDVEDPVRSSTDPIIARHSIWGEIVNKYSKMALTNPSDKLPAFSGLAKEVMKINQDEYIAGMWRQQLHSQLLWCMAYDPEADLRMIGTRPLEYRAPSWTWAAIDGPVRFVAGHESNLIPDGVVSVQLEYATEDKTGALRGGYLDISGSLRSCHLVRFLNKPGKKEKFKWSVIPKDVDFSDGYETRTDEDNFWGVILDSTIPDHFFSSYYELFYLPLWLDEELDVCHALLLRVVNKAEGMYCRIGVVLAVGHEHVRAFYNDSSNDATLPCRAYKDGLHTIRII